MFDPSTLAVFAFACFAMNVSPGPDMLLVATRSAAQGRLAGFATYGGIAAGAYCHGIALALGLSQLFLAVPFAYDIVRYAGAAYLLFLAWQAIRSGVGQGTSRQVPRVSGWVMFRQGLITNVLNPKVALFFLALLPQFVDPERGAVGVQVLILVSILNFSGLIVNGAVVLVSASARRALSAGGALAQIGRWFTALVFTGLAARLLLDTSR